MLVTVSGSAIHSVVSVVFLAVQRESAFQVSRLSYAEGHSSELTEHHVVFGVVGLARIGNVCVSFEE